MLIIASIFINAKHEITCTAICHADPPQWLSKVSATNAQNIMNAKHEIPCTAPCHAGPPQWPSKVPASNAYL
jgi:hypothetical protein